MAGTQDPTAVIRLVFWMRPSRIADGGRRAGATATPCEVSLSRWFSFLNGFEQLDSEWSTSAMVFNWLGKVFWNWPEDDMEGHAGEAAVQGILEEDAMADPGVAPDGGVAPAPGSDSGEEEPARRRLTGKQVLAKLRAQSSNTMELAGKLLQDRWCLLTAGVVVGGAAE